MNYPQPPRSIFLSSSVNYETYVQQWAGSLGIPYYPGLHEDILEATRLELPGGRFSRRSPVDLQQFYAHLQDAKGKQTSAYLQAWVADMAYARHTEGQAGLPPDLISRLRGLSHQEQQQIARASALTGGLFERYVQGYRQETETYQQALDAYYAARAEYWARAKQVVEVAPIRTVTSAPTTGPASEAPFKVVKNKGFGNTTFRQKKYLKGAMVGGKKVGGQWGPAIAITDEEKAQIGAFVKKALNDNYQQKIGKGTTGNLKRSVEQATIDLGFGSGTNTVITVALADVQYQREVPADPRTNPGGFKWVTRSTNEYAQYVFFGTPARIPRNARFMTWFHGPDRHQVAALKVRELPRRDIFMLTQQQHDTLVGLLSQVFGEGIRYEIVSA